MKKYLFTMLLIVALATARQAQIGLGMGSSGINVKTSAENDLRFIGRLDFFIGGFSRVTPEINLVHQFVNESQINAYFGGKLGAVIGDGFDEDFINIGVPLGIEFFPLEGKKLSVAVESGLLLQASEDIFLYIPSIVEFTFYLR